jgi:hypothetical protein
VMPPRRGSWLTNERPRTLHGEVSAFDEISLAPAIEGRSEATARLTALLSTHPPVIRDRAVMLIAELVRESRAPGPGERLQVRVSSRPGAVRVEVRDDGDGSVLGSLRRGGDAGSREGWGPPLLSSTADRWGLVSEPEGAWVWFELDEDGSRSS